jgi:hypothetical protein
MTERKFIIKIFLPDNSYKFLHNVRNTSLGYSKLKTKYIEKAKVWKYKKSCEKIVVKLIQYPYRNEKTIYEYEIVEITDIQILRKIKLQKLQ